MYSSKSVTSWPGGVAVPRRSRISPAVSGRALVDVDLVAEQEELVGPALAIAAGHLLGEHPERVDLEAVFVFVLRRV